MPSDILKDKLNAQFNWDPGPFNSPKCSFLTTKSSLAVNELNQPSESAEVKKALKHCESAPGPDGWTYTKLLQIKGFAENYVDS